MSSDPSSTNGFEVDPFAEFEVRPLPRFAFTSAKRVAAALRKKAVALLESSSLEEQAALEWGSWAKTAQDSMMRGYNLRWKMTGPTPKSVSEFLRGVK